MSEVKDNIRLGLGDGRGKVLEMRAAGKSEFGLCGVVGGKMVIELLAGKMRLVRGGIAAVEDDMRQTYTVKHIWKGLTLLS